jgi:hypothetical protein
VSQQPYEAYCVVNVGDAAAARLGLFDLEPGYFVSAVEQAHDRRGLYEAPVYPKMLAGQIMWAETIAALRGRLLANDDGWLIGSRHNYETVFRTDKRIAIAVVGGNRNTGIDGPPPRTARKRGPITMQRVSSNISPNQLPLFPAEGADDETGCEDWIFLISARDNMLYSELSHADGMYDPRSPRWRERNILPSVAMPGAITPIETGGDEGAMGDVDVDSV